VIDSRDASCQLVRLSVRPGVIQRTHPVSGTEVNPAIASIIPRTPGADCLATSMIAQPEAHAIVNIADTAANT